MGLLNPLLLMLGAAAAVPLLLHLLQRHHGPRVLFPALRYLQRAEKESARRIRLRQILLMLLRIAAVLLLAFAAARPFVRAGGIGHPPTAVVIVLDNSMSTGVVDGERRVLDDLKARALEVLARAGPEDRFWLLRTGHPGEPAISGTADATALRVRETEPTAAAADITGAIAHAHALLAAGAEGRAAEIHVLTDLQLSSIGAALPATAGAPPVIVWHPGRPAPPNRAITAVELGGGLAPIAGQRTALSATIDGSTDTAVAVRLHVDGRLAAAGAAATGTSLVLPLPPRPAGIISGHVEIDADALHADDRRYFAARVLPPPAVALDGDMPFVSDALAVLAEAGRVRHAGASVDVAILPGAVGVELRSAGTALVILPPASPADLAAVNRRLATAGIPWRFEAPLAGEARFAPDDADPLMRSLATARLRQVYPLTRAPDATPDSVLLRLSDGGAWAVRGERAVGGTYVLLASPLTAEASTVPTSAAMLPLLDRVTSAWSLAVPPRTTAEPADEIALTAAATAVQRPDGTRDDVRGAGRYRFGAEPGVYLVLEGDDVAVAYALNPAASESDLRRLDRAGLDARLPGWTLHVVTDERGWSNAAFRERLGRELWRPLLYALLVVLTIETLVAAAGRSRHAGASRAAQAEAG